jgi:hypothetical protein
MDADAIYKALDGFRKFLEEQLGDDKMVAQFLNYLHVRLFAENCKDVERVKTVLQLAGALLAPESLGEFKPYIKNGQELIKKTYG